MLLSNEWIYAIHHMFSSSGNYFAAACAGGCSSDTLRRSLIQSLPKEVRSTSDARPPQRDA